MYWMEYKVNKRLDRIVEVLVMECYIPSLNKYQSTLLRQAISCFILNCSFHISVGHNQMSVTLRKESYSKPPIYNGVLMDRRVSYKYSKLFIEWLDENGYVILHKGKVSKWTNDELNRLVPESFESSYVIILDKLSSLITTSLEHRIHTPVIPSVISVRDSKGNYVAKKMRKTEKKLVDLLNSYNYNSRKFDIESNGGCYDIQIRKVFNQNSWELGGRSYVVGRGSEIMWKTFREKITIDGEPTIELDYKSLHPNILACKMGVKLPEGFDPYGIQIDGYDPKVLRRICKILLLCSFNANSMSAAIGATMGELTSETGEDEKTPIINEWKQKGLVPNVIELKRIAEKLCEHNSYAKDYFFSGVGLELQNIDSRIMDCILELFLEKDEFVLPIHDSILIAERLREFGIECMEIAYQHVLGTLDNCRIEEK